MSKSIINSRQLRQLAQGIVEQIGERLDLADDACADLITSLVRQWITYDGHATLILDGQQVYYVLHKTPLGKPRVVPELEVYDWHEQLQRRWNIAPEELPEVFDQLNRGQSAEVTDRAEVPLRVWVDPRERGQGAESLAEQAVPAAVKRNYHELALRALEKQFGQFGPELEPDEMEALACSLTKQWRNHDGHAALFFDGGHILFTITDLPDACCRVKSVRKTGTVEPMLRSHGVPEDAIPEAVVLLNLGQVVEFQNGEGVRCRLWSDPKKQNIYSRPIDPAPADPFVNLPPVFCPACRAVLRPWQSGEQRQPCPRCGRTVSMSDR